METRDRDLVEQLGVPHRTSVAYRGLLRSGRDALPAVRDGLRHGSADVRYHCCRFLDRFLEPETLDALIAMLSDGDCRVRLAVPHTLACDRCKEVTCRPEEAAVLPRAMALLAGDPDAHVRAMAIEVVGGWVHTNAAATAAIRAAQQSDPSAAVRKKAGWYAPGGTIHRRVAARLDAAVTRGWKATA
jgi:hypothetical protein